jgi:hypothetical protein
LANRKNKSAIPLPMQLLLVVAAIAFCIWVIQHELALVLLVTIVAGSVVIAVRFILPASRQRTIVAKADAMIQQHAEQLARRRSQLVRQDAYGKPILDKWLAEIEHFTIQHIRPFLSTSEQSVFDARRDEFIQLITARIEELVPSKLAFEAFTASMRPSEFEAFLARTPHQRKNWHQPTGYCSCTTPIFRS